MAAADAKKKNCGVKSGVSYLPSEGQVREAQVGGGRLRVGVGRLSFHLTVEGPVRMLRMLRMPESLVVHVVDGGGKIRAYRRGQRTSIHRRRLKHTRQVT